MNTKVLVLVALMLAAGPSFGVRGEDMTAAMTESPVGLLQTSDTPSEGEDGVGKDLAVGCAAGAAVGSPLLLGAGTLIGCGLGALIAWVL